MATFNLCPTIKINSVGSCFTCTKGEKKKKERRNSTGDIDTTNIVMIGGDTIPDLEILKNQKFKSYDSIMTSKDLIASDCMILLTPEGELITHTGYNSEKFVRRENLIDFWREKVTALYIIFKHVKEKRKEQIVLKFPTGERYRLDSNFCTDKKTDKITIIIICIKKVHDDEQDITDNLAE